MKGDLNDTELKGGDSDGVNKDQKIESKTKSQIHTEENAREAETCRWSSFRTEEEEEEKEKKKEKKKRRRRRNKCSLPVTTVMDRQSTETNFFFITENKRSVQISDSQRIFYRFILYFKVNL
jgi:hypothetical protein